MNSFDAYFISGILMIGLGYYKTGGVLILFAIFDALLQR
jgi:hypothetical protein